MPSKIFILGKEVQQMPPLTTSVPCRSVGFFIIYQIIAPLNQVRCSLQLSPEDLKPSNRADIQEAEGQEQSHWIRLMTHLMLYFGFRVNHIRCCREMHSPNRELHPSVWEISSQHKAAWFWLVSWGWRSETCSLFLHPTLVNYVLQAAVFCNYGYVIYFFF